MDTHLYTEPVLQHMPRREIKLAKEWDVSPPGLFGKRRHMLSLEEDDDSVLLMVTVFPKRMIQWLCSPPTHEAGNDYANGEIAINADVSEEVALARGKELAHEAWLKWVAEDNYGGD